MTKVEPFTVAREFHAIWLRDKASVVEMRKLRKEGLSYEKIAQKVGRSYSTVWEALKRDGEKK